MSRLQLQSPAFGRDLRKWLKSHPDTAASLEATLEQLSVDAAQPGLRAHNCAVPWRVAGPVVRITICELSSNTRCMKERKRSSCSPLAHTIRFTEAVKFSGHGAQARDPHDLARLDRDAAVRGFVCRRSVLVGSEYRVVLGRTALMASNLGQQSPGDLPATE